MAAAVATQEVFAHTDALVETWDVGADIAEGTLVKQGSRYGIVLTNSPGQTGKDTLTYGPYSISRTKVAGVGNDSASAISANAAGVALDGTWEFGAITGVTTGTAQGTVIYADSTNALTTTATGNTQVGVVNYPATYVKAAAKAPVKIGA